MSLGGRLGGGGWEGGGGGGGRRWRGEREVAGEGVTSEQEVFLTVLPTDYCFT